MAYMNWHNFNAWLDLHIQATDSIAADFLLRQ